jgi:LuxR family maltose regulon positive regulatory protein
MSAASLTPEAARSEPKEPRPPFVSEGVSLTDVSATLATMITTVLRGDSRLLRADELRVRIEATATGIRVEVDSVAPRAVPLTLTVTPLSRSELRVLRYMQTRLSFPEIAERLCVSRHTVKSQAVSIYRKLGVSTRSAAVEAAYELRLLTEHVPRPDDRPTPDHHRT